MKKAAPRTTSKPETSNSGRVSFRFPPDVMNRLMALSKKTGLNRQGVAALAITELAERKGL